MMSQAQDITWWRLALLIVLVLGLLGISARLKLELKRSSFIKKNQLQPQLSPRGGLLGLRTTDSFRASTGELPLDAGHPRSRTPRSSEGPSRFTSASSPR